MFERSTLFAIMNDGSLKKFQMTNNFSNTRTFFNGLYNRYEGYTKSEYTYGYKNDYNELSYVEHFQIEKRIIDAVTDASTISNIILASNNQMNDIKFLFMGQIDVDGEENNSVILFQKIQKSQVISNGKGLKMIASGNTFNVFTENLLSILDRLDCYFVNGRLNFNSIYFARQIFDMSSYVVEATEEDIRNFASNPVFTPESVEIIRNIKNQNLRNKIKYICDSGILEQHNAASIREVSSIVGLDIEVKTADDGTSKIDIPRKNKDLKIFIKVLDETVYEGLLSRQLRESNSSKPFDR